LLINGDLMDYYQVSRFQKDPSKRDFDAEIDSGESMLAYLRAEFKKCRIVYKEGNHDERFKLWLRDNAVTLAKLSKKIKFLDTMEKLVHEALGIEKYGIEIVSDQRPVMVGHLPVLHGHEAGKTGLTSSVNSARGLFLKTLSTMLVGHGHRTSQHAETDWRHKQTSTWSTGCLCMMNPEYWRMGNKWNWGAANIVVDKTGAFHVDNYRIGPSGEIW